MPAEVEALFLLAIRKTLRCNIERVSLCPPVPQLAAVLRRATVWVIRSYTMFLARDPPEVVSRHGYGETSHRAGY